MQIDRKKKSNFNTYPWGTQISMTTPKTIRQNEVYMSFRGLGLQREVKQFTGDEKSLCLASKSLLAHLETVGHREDFDQKDLKSFLPIRHI